MTAISQNDLSFGHHFMRPMGPEYDHLIVFGRIPSVAELVASEIFGVTEYGDYAHYQTTVAQARDVLRSIEPATLAGAIDGTGGYTVQYVWERIIRHAPDSDGSGLGAFEWMHRLWTTGQRFTKAYSLACTDGEYGSTPLHTMIPISADEFDDARIARWDMRAMAAVASPNYKQWANELIMAGLRAAFQREVTV